MAHEKKVHSRQRRREKETKNNKFSIVVVAESSTNSAYSMAKHNLPKKQASDIFLLVVVHSQQKLHWSATIFDVAV